MYKKHNICRVCGSDELVQYLDLGELPLSNNLADYALDPIHDKKYPLQVLLCQKCGLSQLSVVVDPVELFSNYVYRSSISQGYKDHCREMAIDLKDKYNLGKDSFHVDIAGNDGALLNEFLNVIGGDVLNVDPACNLAAICEARGIPVLKHFFNSDSAFLIMKRSGHADLITATNVVAHVDDINNFITSAIKLLKPKGKLVIEFPYLVNFIENKEFDTIYFEHLSYLSIYPISIIVEKTGFEILDVNFYPIHGGSIRVTIGRGDRTPKVQAAIQYEIDNYHSIVNYRKFATDVKNAIHNFSFGLKALKKHKVAAFAASAKGNTLMNVAKITPNEISYIIDETPEKISKYSPGTRIQIVGMDMLHQQPPDYLVILSWNFADEIKQKCRDHGYKGKFIIPIPDFLITL